MSENNLKVNSFYKYLISNGYYYDKELIENYLLSLKVKPFEILTGNSGTGKTKLSLLFAKFLNGVDYHNIKVTTRGRSWGYKKKDNTEGHNCGWTLFSDYIKNFFPLDEFQGNYEIQVGDYVSNADIKLKFQLYYDKNNEELKNYFKNLYLYEEEIIKKDKNEGKSHKKQFVDLFIDCDAINTIFTDNFIKNEEIIITMNNIGSFRSGDVILSNDIFNYIPINNYVDCNIMANDIFSEAHFELKFRISNYLTDEINSYLDSIEKNNEATFELKIKGFNPNIKTFNPNFNIVKIFKNNPNYSIIPIGANWTDNTNILGYYNVITEDYQSTPAFELIKQAKKDLKNPYFLILDEMNLSHVERYFADFLSAIESDEEIPLYGNKESLKLPKNLFIIGTVNVDETTYMFSPKVLDRANTIEFSPLTAKEYMSSDLDEGDFEGNINYLQSPLTDSDISNFNIGDLKEILSGISCNDNNLWDILAIELTAFQETLKDYSFDFGFRIINEILRFMVVAWRYENEPNEWDNWERYFDAQIKQKILPKLHGSEKAIGNVLTKLFNICLEDKYDNENPKNFTLTEENCRYYTSALKLQNMSKVLSNQRYVSFIN
ncbi:MAG: hypothetical protein IKH29_03880 [Methanobrevibacter sp.]|uniref:McrB family protein n=1 Tax=Methanobrevibacter sp. TaxID=66852 RepID=UPI0025E2A830|nr:hypothetical protein [Methanobrevibacter sp.]MBR3112836.1 hypothetical protein [Methanobrevibacter sp.]MBR4634423.1 hypothetical protein [bacterium]